MTASQNRFKALCSDQDHPGHDCSLEDELCDSQGGVDARESKAGRSDLPPPRLADDILGEAFELRKEIQVQVPSTVRLQVANITLYRRWMIC